MADLSPFPPVALCVSVQVHPSLPSHSKSFGHRPGGESNRLSGAFPGILRGSVCSLGSWLSVGTPPPTTGRLTLLCSLSYTLFSIFSYFRTHLFIAIVPPCLCPDSQVTALYYFLLISLNSAASIPKPGKFHLSALSDLVSHQWSCKAPLHLCGVCWLPYTKDKNP